VSKKNRLGIPSKVNVYDRLVAMSANNADIAALLDCLHKTLEHFQVPRADWRQAGDVIQRFSLLICLQDEQVSIGDDPSLNVLADMVEHFHALAGDKLKSFDPVPSWPRRFSK